MIKTLLSQVKQYKKASILTPLFMLLEVVVEMSIPRLMAVIVDEGITAGNMNAIVVNGFLGSGCVQIDLYDDGTCEMQMGQELEPTEYPDNCGRMRLIADAQLEGGKIQADQSIEYISGDYVRNVAEINGDVFRFFGVDDEGNFTYNNYLMPAALDSEGQGYWMGGHFCAFEFVLYHGDATGIEEQHMTLEQKLKSAKTYNMLGQRVDRAQTKGLLVRNGKKFLSK